MGGLKTPVQAEDVLFLQALLDHEDGDALSLVEAFERISVEKYDELSGRIVGRKSIVEGGNEEDLTRLRSEQQTWLLLKMLASHRLFPRRLTNDSSEASLPSELDDQMVACYAIEQDVDLKEGLVIVKWLEMIYPQHNPNMVKAAALDLNGKHQVKEVKENEEEEEGDLDSKHEDDRQPDRSFQSTSTSTSSSADQNISQQLWHLYRGGRYDEMKALARGSGQDARVSLIESMSSPFASSLFSDLAFIDQNHPSPLSTLQEFTVHDMKNEESIGSERGPRGVIQRHLLRQASMAVSQQTLSKSKEYHNDKSGGSYRQGDINNSGVPQSSIINPYERALYSSYSGSFGGMKDVVHSWEDFIWAHVKCWANERLYQWLVNHPLAWSNPSNHLNDVIHEDKGNNNKKNDSTAMKMDLHEEGHVSEDKKNEKKFSPSSSSISSTTPHMFKVHQTSMDDALRAAMGDMEMNKTNKNILNTMSNTTAPSSIPSSSSHDYLVDLFASMQNSDEEGVRRESQVPWKLIISQLVLRDTKTLAAMLASFTSGTQSNTSSTASSPSFLRFSVHLILALIAFEPSIVQHHDPSNQSDPSFNTFVDHVTLMMTRYIEYLMDSDEGELIAHYCSRMPPSKTNVGIELYVKYLRRIKTTKEREKALQRASHAGLPAQMIAALLVEDVIREPNNNDKHLHSKGRNDNRMTLVKKNVKNGPPKHFGVSGYGAPSGVPSSRWNLNNNDNNDDGLSSLNDRSNVNNRTNTSNNNQLNPPTSTSSVPHLMNIEGQFYDFSSSVVSVEDRERIESLEWLALDEAASHQRFQCLMHANALGRAFILSNSVAAAQVLFSTVDTLLASLFKSIEDPSSQAAMLLDPELNIEEAEKEMSEEEGLENDLSSSAPTAASSRQLFLVSQLSIIQGESTTDRFQRLKDERDSLREYFALRMYMNALSAYSTWRTDFIKHKTSQTSTSSQQPSYLPFPSSLNDLTDQSISSLMDVANFPHGWLNMGESGRIIEGINTRKNAGSVGLSRLNRIDQLDQLKHRCLPEVVFLLQHVMLSSGRFDSVLKLAEHLASNMGRSALYAHFSALNMQSFLKGVAQAMIETMKDESSGTMERLKGRTGAAASGSGKQQREQSLSNKTRTNNKNGHFSPSPLIF